MWVVHSPSSAMMLIGDSRRAPPTRPLSVVNFKLIALEEIRALVEHAFTTLRLLGLNSFGIAATEQKQRRVSSTNPPQTTPQSVE